MKLTVVHPNTPARADPDMLKALDRIVTEARAARPVAVFVVFEMPDGAVQLRSYPDSGALRTGMIDHLHGWLHDETE